MFDECVAGQLDCSRVRGGTRVPHNAGYVADACALCCVYSLALSGVASRRQHDLPDAFIPSNTTVQHRTMLLESSADAAHGQLDWSALNFTSIAQTGNSCMKRDLCSPTTR
jgi:hypothetical protein